MRAVLLLLFLTVFVIVNANDQQAEDLVEGVHLEETLYRHPRAICYPLSCNQICFPRLGSCYYNTCRCN
uniref:AlCRP n=1 Tax=Acalolepta luxuriosa TaxID=85306 RepID=Q7YT38_ACALU|nr:AlCRP precursor [Acalolepta luxuriosa]